MDYPKVLTQIDHTEPVPRRIRATLGGSVVLDTTSAMYVWEIPYYPQYYIPLRDLEPSFLDHPTALHVYAGDAGALAGMARVEWSAVDAWFEEDEQVFVHPRSPYVRVDALRSSRHVRIEINGTVLAESSSSIMVFETGLPTRHYLNRSEVHFEHLIASRTQTACPYKGVTSGYWSVQAENEILPDLAWTYDFPTRQLLPIAGLVAFYDEKVDTFVDGTLMERPRTHFS